ncbi:MAG TPA: helix-turn-helix domain-containing protein [Acidimicrobiales bacterium]|nr:helix-turn-helix domain-containing protein [Acidimicrobiales bacterium]
MRADAQRNRRLILEAACGLFIEFGVQASLEAVARRAGVGIATLYRHFPHRRALVTAVAADVMARTGDEARAALADETDAFAALRRYMHRSLDVGAPAIMPQLDEDVRNDPEVRSLLDSTAAAQQQLLRAADEQGSLRAGVEFADVGLALARFSRPIGGGFDPALEEGVAHRHLDVFIDGLRNRGRERPLEGPAPTLRELRRMGTRADPVSSAPPDASAVRAVVLDGNRLEE